MARFNHIELTVPKGTLDIEGKKRIVGVYHEPFGREDDTIESSSNNAELSETQRMLIDLDIHLLNETNVNDRRFDGPNLGFYLRYKSPLWCDVQFLDRTRMPVVVDDGGHVCDPPPRWCLSMDGPKEEARG